MLCWAKYSLPDKAIKYNLTCILHADMEHRFLQIKKTIFSMENLLLNSNGNKLLFNKTYNSSLVHRIGGIFFSKKKKILGMIGYNATNNSILYTSKSFYFYTRLLPQNAVMVRASNKIDTLPCHLLI